MVRSLSRYWNVPPAPLLPVRIVAETESSALPEWEARCKSQGLLMTAPRRAILSAMLRSDQARLQPIQVA
jgi:hypothetical protein